MVSIKKSRGEIKDVVLGFYDAKNRQALVVELKGMFCGYLRLEELTTAEVIARRKMLE